jgi:energy-converting hydrogenase B subunit D
MLELIELVHVVVLLLILLSALYAVEAKDLIVAVISMSVMSLLVALEFYLLHAPDVAIAEASIGAGLTAAIFLIAIKSTKRMEEE